MIGKQLSVHAFTDAPQQGCRTLNIRKQERQRRHTPSLGTCRTVADEPPQYLGSPVLGQHQRHQLGGRPPRTTA
jgi:hypothetical protein